MIRKKLRSSKCLLCILLQSKSSACILKRKYVHYIATSKVCAISLQVSKCLLSRSSVWMRLHLKCLILWIHNGKTIEFWRIFHVKIKWVVSLLLSLLKALKALMRRKSRTPQSSWVHRAPDWRTETIQRQQRCAWRSNPPGWRRCHLMKEELWRKNKSDN